MRKLIVYLWTKVDTYLLHHKYQMDAYFPFMFVAAITDCLFWMITFPQNLFLENLWRIYSDHKSTYISLSYNFMFMLYNQVIFKVVAWILTIHLKGCSRHKLVIKVIHLQYLCVWMVLIDKQIFDTKDA